MLVIFWRWCRRRRLQVLVRQNYLLRDCIAKEVSAHGGIHYCGARCSKVKAVCRGDYRTAQDGGNNVRNKHVDDGQD